MIRVIRLFSFGLLLLTATTLSACATPSAIRQGVAPGVVSPEFVAARLEGGELNVSSLRGQVVVLDIWAAWCEGCEKDLPSLDAMAIRLKELPVKVLAVSIDSERERIEPIVKSRVWQLQMLHDPAKRVADLYQPAKMPAVYVIDRSGVVRHVHVGLRPEEIADVEREARALSR